MTANDLFIDAFGRVREVVHDAAEGLDEETLTFQPADNANTIAWLIWHLTRIQDDHVADLMGEEQIWTKGGWHQRFNLPFDSSATGYGHSPDDVAAVKTSADLLRGYHDAVQARTVDYLKTLKSEDYDRVIDTNYSPPVTVAVRLVSVISDDLQHAGQAAYVRGLLP